MVSLSNQDGLELLEEGIEQELVGVALNEYHNVRLGCHTLYKIFVQHGRVGLGIEHHLEEVLAHGGVFARGELQHAPDLGGLDGAEVGYAVGGGHTQPDALGPQVLDQEGRVAGGHHAGVARKGGDYLQQALEQARMDGIFEFLEHQQLHSVEAGGHGHGEHVEYFLAAGGDAVDAGVLVVVAFLDTDIEPAVGHLERHVSPLGEVNLHRLEVLDAGEQLEQGAAQEAILGGSLLAKAVDEVAYLALARHGGAIAAYTILWIGPAEDAIGIVERVDSTHAEGGEGLHEGGEEELRYPHEAVEGQGVGLHGQGLVAAACGRGHHEGLGGGVAPEQLAVLRLVAAFGPQPFSGDAAAGKGIGFRAVDCGGLACGGAACGVEVCGTVGGPLEAVAILVVGVVGGASDFELERLTGHCRIDGDERALRHHLASLNGRCRQETDTEVHSHQHVALAVVVGRHQ